MEWNGDDMKRQGDFPHHDRAKVTGKRLKKMLASRLWMFFFRPCLATEKSRADQTPSQWDFDGATVRNLEPENDTEDTLW